MVDCQFITDIVFDAQGCVTNFVMSSVGEWVDFVYDDDDSAFYNQPATRTNRKITVNGQANLKFSGITKEIVAEANAAKDCCCLVFVHFFNSGIALVQGIEYNATTGEWKFTKTNAKITPAINSDTGANEDNLVFTIDHVGGCFSPATTLDADAILAL